MPHKQEIDLEDIEAWNERQNVWAQCSDGLTHKVLSIGDDNTIQTYQGEQTVLKAYIVANSELLRKGK